MIVDGGGIVLYGIVLYRIEEEIVKYFKECFKPTSTVKFLLGETAAIFWDWI